jgi:hypothetical protein
MFRYDVGWLHPGYISLDGRREDVGWGSNNGLAARMTLLAPCSRAANPSHRGQCLGAPD